MYQGLHDNSVKVHCIKNPTKTDKKNDKKLAEIYIKRKQKKIDFVFKTEKIMLSTTKSTQNVLTLFPILTYSIHGGGGGSGGGGGLK